METKMEDKMETKMEDKISPSPVNNETEGEDVNESNIIILYLICWQ